MATTDPALEAAMSLAARRRNIPETLSEIYIAWNLCFRAYCDRYDRPWPNHRVVPDFITYLRDNTSVTRDELIHAVDAIIFGLEETRGLAGPLKTALRARVLSEVPPAPVNPHADRDASADHSTDHDSFSHRSAALTRVMVAMDEESFNSYGRRFQN